MRSPAVGFITASDFNLDARSAAVGFIAATDFDAPRAIGETLILSLRCVDRFCSLGLGVFNPMLVEDDPPSIESEKTVRRFGVWNAFWVRVCSRTLSQTTSPQGD